MNITPAILMAAGLSESVADRYAEPLSVAGRRFDLTTPRRMAALIGQCRVESTNFTVLRENLNYTTASRLLTVFPSAFRTLADTAGYVGNPTALANKVYANRLGNGDEASGDGARFAGKGLIQLTGRDNYQAASDAISFNYVADPERLTLPLDACLTAAWFFHSRKCHLMADKRDWDSVTRAVNGRAMLHRAERAKYSDAALAAFERINRSAT